MLSISSWTQCVNDAKPACGLLMTWLWFFHWSGDVTHMASENPWDWTTLSQVIGFSCGHFLSCSLIYIYIYIYIYHSTYCFSVCLTLSYHSNILTALKSEIHILMSIYMWLICKYDKAKQMSTKCVWSFDSGIWIKIIEILISWPSYA